MNNEEISFSCFIRYLREEFEAWNISLENMINIYNLIFNFLRNGGNRFKKKIATKKNISR